MFVFCYLSKKKRTKKKRVSNKKITYTLSSHQSFFFFSCAYSRSLFFSFCLSSLFRLVYKKENKQKMMYSLSLLFNWFLLVTSDRFIIINRWDKIKCKIDCCHNQLWKYQIFPDIVLFSIIKFQSMSFICLLCLYASQI